MRPVRTRAALALLPWVFTAFPSGTAAQETAFVDPVAIAGDLRALRPQTGDADLAVEAVLALTAILDQLDAARDPGGRPPQIENELFLRALEYRARAHVTRESPEQASDDLRLLILADPTWRLDVAGLSPAVLDLFEEQRSELLAYLTVLTEPAGVTVFVEEEPVGATPLTGRPVFAGLLTIRLERPGFTVYTEPRREVLAGEMITIEHEMVRSRPVLSVITSPAGVTVRVGGRVAGVTGGSLPEDLRPLVPPRFARDEFSAPLQLGNLETGANEITLEAPCRTPSRFTFHADEARDYLPRFVRLRPSTGGLRIESEPSGATVVLDGEERGVTPLSFSAMCSGEHEVEIRHPAGRCARSVTVSRGSRTAVSCEVLPVLAMTPSDPQEASEADRAVRRVLEARDDYFVMDGGDEPDVQARVRVRLPEPGAGPAQVEFLAAGSGTPDVTRFDRFAPASAGAAAERLLTPPTRRRPWIGMTAVALANSGAENGPGGLRVTSVHPAGPAVLAGVEPGDELREVEGRLLSDELGLAELVAGESPGATIDLVVRREGNERQLRLVLAETPVLPSLSAEKCNRRLVELEADFARGRSDATRQLEAGICWILLGDPERALVRYLADVRAGVGAGIGEGTVLYYRALALDALGERARAAQAFEAAAAAPGATLVTHDGPLLAPLAARRLGTAN
ncbi:MAG: PEGA domain-containing protein [Acidobacteria bacterium]|nr:PEGA domain-containing protein [Acidobacteriota bacterium]MYG75368.1 PEGA domain-containing protein [Acidobacteriota bacterium]